MRILRWSRSLIWSTRGGFHSFPPKFLMFFNLHKKTDDDNDDNMENLIEPDMLLLCFQTNQPHGRKSMFKAWSIRTYGRKINDIVGQWLQKDPEVCFLKNEGTCHKAILWPALLEKEDGGNEKNIPITNWSSDMIDAKPLLVLVTFLFFFLLVGNHYHLSQIYILWNALDFHYCCHCCKKCPWCLEGRGVEWSRSGHINFETKDDCKVP